MTTAEPADTARSGEVGTQTEPPKVDAGIQAELSDLTTAESAAPEVAGSRPATRQQRPATKDVAAAGRRLSRPPTQSRTAKPPTAAGAVDGAILVQQPPTPGPSELGLDLGQPPVLFVDNHRAWQQFQESSAQQRQRGGSECTPMVYSYNPDPRLRAWQSLEHARLHQLGLSSKLSRRYNVQRSRQFMPVGLHMRSIQQPELRAAFLPPLVEDFAESTGQKKNDVAPFLTFQKPTCGFFFSRETDNRKIKHGLAPADLPKWGGTDFR